MINIILRFLLFLLIEGIVCLSYFSAIVSYENGRGLLTSAIMISMSTFVSLMISYLLWRT